MLPHFAVARLLHTQFRTPHGSHSWHACRTIIECISQLFGTTGGTGAAGTTGAAGGIGGTGSAGVVEYAILKCHGLVQKTCAIIARLTPT